MFVCFLFYYLTNNKMTTVLSSKVFATRVTLVAGASTTAPANLNGSSQLVSITRITAGGGVNEIPVATLVPPTAPAGGAVWQLGVFSSVNTDVSVYEVEWYNQYIPSQLLAQSGLVAGVQYSP